MDPREKLRALEEKIRSLREIAEDAARSASERLSARNEIIASEFAKKKIEEVVAGLPPEIAPAAEEAKAMISTLVGFMAGIATGTLLDVAASAVSKIGKGKGKGKNEDEDEVKKPAKRKSGTKAKKGQSGKKRSSGKTSKPRSSR